MLFIGYGVKSSVSLEFYSLDFHLANVGKNCSVCQSISKPNSKCWHLPGKHPITLRSEFLKDCQPACTNWLFVDAYKCFCLQKRGLLLIFFKKIGLLVYGTPSLGKMATSYFSWQIKTFLFS